MENRRKNWNCATSVHHHWGVNRFEQVRTGVKPSVSTSLHGLPLNFTHALKICLGRFLSPFRSARLIWSGGNGASSRFNWRKVWTGVKCNFYSVHHYGQYVVGKLSISQVWMWNFTRIGCKTKKVRLSINLARRQWPGTTHKKVWTTTFLRQNSTSCTSLESSRSRKLQYAVSAGLVKRRQLQLFKFLEENLENFAQLSFIMRLLRNRQFFFSPAPRAVLPWIALD